MSVRIEVERRVDDAIGPQGQQLVDVIRREHAGGRVEPAQLGRITALSDLPDEKTLLRYVRKAAALNDQGVKAPNRAKKPPASRELEIPDDLQAALHASPQAAAAFEGFSYSHKKEYVDWINEAKRAETRAQRLATTIEWLAQGKHRMWKYEARR